MSNSLYSQHTDYLKEQITHCEEVIAKRKNELARESDELIIEVLNESIEDWTTTRNNFNDLLKARGI